MDIADLDRPRVGIGLRRDGPGEWDPCPNCGEHLRPAFEVGLCILRLTYAKIDLTRDFP